MQPSDSLSQHFRIDAEHQKALKRLKIETVEDLLFHLPQRYEDINDIQSVGGLVSGQDAVVFGRIGGLKSRRAWKSKRPIAEGYVEDGSARIKIMWFNQPYLAKMLQDGMYAKIAGKVTGTEGKLYIANPEVERLDSLPTDRSDSIFNNTENLDDTIYPVYPETKGVTSKWFYHHVKLCFEKGVLDRIADPIPAAILKRYNLPTLVTALQWVHTPKKAAHAESARKRFAFEEVFFIQAQKALERAEANAATTYSFKTDEAHIRAFTDRFPFPLTHAQKNAIGAILKDFSGNHAMSRLLEGDVGSGKTAVAATTAYAVATSRPPISSSKDIGNAQSSSATRRIEKQFSILPPLASLGNGISNFERSSRRGESDTRGVSGNTMSMAQRSPQQRNSPKFEMPSEWGNLQVAYMAPTEILAKQHFESFIEYFKHLPIQIGLLTGSVCMKFPSKVDGTKPTKISKAQLVKWVKNGEIPILIGTHALIYKSVEFKHLAHVIIDEQHRFGTNQRKALAKKDQRMPHLLSMTATPIPRTLALSIYGDLDITLLDEMPKGRKPIITKIITPEKQHEMYAHVKSELEAGRQAYVICPRIDEPDPEKETAIQAKSVKAEAERLKKEVFPHARIDMLHSKMKPAEKEQIMAAFLAHEIDILVATSVVEVGVNVPNATNIIIEGAERFGLSQLHQLRGRVIRGTHQAYCFAVTASKSQKTKDRLKALSTAKNGFELAEYDLQFRGAGVLYGAKQSGISDLGMEALRNLKLVEAARTEAQTLVKADPHLKKHPEIQKRIAALGEALHLE